MDKNLFRKLMGILFVILTMLDVVTRGIPITWSNFTVLNVAMIFSIIFTLFKYIQRADQKVIK